MKKVGKHCFVSVIRPMEDWEIFIDRWLCHLSALTYYKYFLILVTLSLKWNQYLNQIGGALKKRFYLFIFERGEGREKESARNIDVREKHRLVASHMLPLQGWNCNPGMCPEWKSNLQPFALGTMPSQLSHTGQSNRWFYFSYFDINEGKKTQNF